jgi:probable rRNA maturation factor
VLVLVSDRQKDLPLKHEKEKIEQLVQSVIQREGRACDEVAIHFVSAKVICKMHKEFFQDPTITDCISFPLDDAREANFCYLGDVFVCPKQAILYAEEHSLDPYREATLYIVHGILHLLGYDDIDESDVKIMRQKEQKHLKHLENQGLILCPR